MQFNLFSKLKNGLSKTRQILTTDIGDLFSKDKEINDNLLEELEELLITSDLGVENSMNIMGNIAKAAKKLKTADELKLVLKQELLNLFPETKKPSETPGHGPRVVMVVGVNGTGKTTTLGKIAMEHTKLGQKVLIGASDTFRAAAIEQLAIWAQRAGASLVKHKQGADPAAVAFDAVEASKARGIDLVLIDTAGRLHTQKNLMEELKKIKRSVGKCMEKAPHEILMVLDATTGQNALSQAELFHKAVNITSIAITKLDGTARGGIVAAVAGRLNIPIKYIGVGESIDDLQAFDAQTFIDALLD